MTRAAARLVGVATAAGLVLAVPLPAGAAEPKRSTVSATVGDATVRAGQVVHVHGHASGRRRAVRLQRRLGSTWRYAGAHATTTASGAYTLRAPTREYVGRTRYRAYVPATSTAAAAYSPTFPLAITGRGAASSHHLSSYPGYGAVHWDPCGVVDYRVNPAHAPRAAVAEVRSALVRVAAQTGLRFHYLGTTTALPKKARLGDLPTGTDLELAWPRRGQTPLLPAGAAGYGGWVSTSATDVHGKRVQEIVRGFAFLNAGLYAKLAPGYGPGPAHGYRGTRQQLLMHELGHVVGLGHTGATGQVMYAVMQSIAAVWGNGDAAGLTRVGVAANACVAH